MNIVRKNEMKTWVIIERKKTWLKIVINFVRKWSGPKNHFVIEMVLWRPLSAPIFPFTNLSILENPIL